MNTLALIFEVLDKEPSIQSIWLTFIFIAIVSYLLCRLRWWLIGLVLPITLSLSTFLLLELLDPYVGPAMWQESRSYVIQSYAAMLIAVVFPCVGAYLERTKRKLQGQ